MESLVAFYSLAVSLGVACSQHRMEELMVYRVPLLGRRFSMRVVLFIFLLPKEDVCPVVKDDSHRATIKRGKSQVIPSVSETSHGRFGAQKGWNPRA